MEISSLVVRNVANKLEEWAAEISWKSAGAKVAEAYHHFGRGELLPAVNTENDIRNAAQRLRRIFRREGQYRKMARQLIPAVLTAMPVIRRAKLEQSLNPVRLAALESVEAVNAVHLGAPAQHIIRERDEAIAALQAMRFAVLSSTGGRLSASAGI
ncbi:toxin YdaT family protein [Pantoea osteomyelitidis]|uniref:Toxin YdaT family protein n=1 Tax=Pantoea osteomyelitidis TaxID=3230026 RepID=A0ABW7PV72_9GAMM